MYRFATAVVCNIYTQNETTIHTHNTLTQQMTFNLFSLFRCVPTTHLNTNGYALYRFKAKGMDIGNAVGEAEALHESDDDENGEYDEDGADIDLLRAKEAQYERPICSVNMDDIKSKFESGHSQSKEERREERKQEVKYFLAA